MDNASIATELGFAISTLDAGWFGAADSETYWWDIRPAPGGFMLTPHGLDPGRRYRLRDRSPDGEGPHATRTGAEWLTDGVPAIIASSYAGILEPAYSNRSARAPASIQSRRRSLGRPTA